MEPKDLDIFLLDKLIAAVKDLENGQKQEPPKPSEVPISPFEPIPLPKQPLFVPGTLPTINPGQTE